MRILRVALMVTSVGWMTWIAGADDVTDQLDRASVLYEEGRYGKAAEELRWAISEIESRQGEQLRSFLPAGLPGFHASQPEVSTIPDGGITASRVYSSGDIRLSLELSLDSPLVQSVGTVFTDPSSATGQPNTRPLALKGEQAIQEYDPGTKHGKITLMMADRLLILLEGRQLDSEQTLADLADQLDLSGIKKKLLE